MAELILTEAEKAAALWTDLDDAALGKVLKKKMALITTSAEQLDQITITAAAMLLCCSAAEANSQTISFSLDGLTQAGRVFGDWQVTAFKTGTKNSGIDLGGSELELRAEVERLRSMLRKTQGEYSHQCINCGHCYNPSVSEDCPVCDCDGTSDLCKGQPGAFLAKTVAKLKSNIKENL